MSKVLLTEECGPYQCRANDLATQRDAFKSDAAALCIELDQVKADLAAAREDVAQLEKWLNEDPEMRLAEVLVGESYRWCVRLEQLVFDEPGSVKFSAEAGTFSEALRAAIDSARAGGGR